MSRGSLWRKWDLHVHTPFSAAHNFKFSNEDESQRYDGDIWEKYVTELESIPDIAVLGVTDYFTIEGYKRIMRYRHSDRLGNYDLVLPNIEFRLDKFVDDKRLNFHVIFDECLSAELIENSFLTNLTITHPSGEPRNLTKENIEEIGQVLKKQHKNFAQRSDFEIGIMNITVSQDEIIKALDNQKTIFGGHYLLVLAQERWDDIDWSGQDHLTRKVLFHKSHALFASNNSTINWAIGKKDISAKKFVEEFGSLKPCLWGSDAHDFDRLLKPDCDRFTWVKADPTFEGLKQVIYEPEDRIRIQRENPDDTQEFHKSIYSLDSVELRNTRVNDDLMLEEQTIPLNRNLVAVTGGKGTGKTALLDLIANCYINRCKNGAKDSNSFVQRIEEDNPELEIELCFIGRDLDSFTKILRENKFFQDSIITYLPQGKIEEYSGNFMKLQEKMEEIIFNSKAIRESSYKVTFDEIKDKIKRYRKEIDEINVGIVTDEKESHEDIESVIKRDCSIKEGELKNKKNELEIITKGLDENTIRQIATLEERQKNLQNQWDEFNDMVKELKELRDDILNSAAGFNIRISGINANLAKFGIVLDMPDIDISSQIKALDSAFDLIGSRVQETTAQLSFSTGELEKLSGIERDQATILEEIDEIAKVISGFKDSLIQIQEKRTALKDLEEKRFHTYISLIRSYREWKDYYNKIIQNFRAEQNEILQGLEFISSIHLNNDKYLDTGTAIFDGRSIKRETIEEFCKRLESIIIEEDDGLFENGISVLINELLQLKNALRSHLTSMNFYEWIFGDYLTLSTNITFNGIPMKKLSMGQKGTVLLKLFLSEGEYPLIIDQPEENLDNKFIYDELVSSIKQAKKKRQIFIATNNANLVVNTDAEQVIIAEFSDNKIAYKSGSLENLNLRNELLPILEGGVEAFRKREDKYGIQRS